MNENANDILSKNNSKNVEMNSDNQESGAAGLNDVVAERLRRDQENNLQDDEEYVTISKLRNVVEQSNNLFTALKRQIDYLLEKDKKNTDSIMTLQTEIRALKDYIRQNGGGNGQIQI